MPPKPKKPKAKKPKPKSKAVQSTTGTRAIAKTTKAPAQAQNVTIRIGEVKKAPARRRRPPAKPKGVPPPQPTDGWYPPQNLGRNGASFAGAETIRYVNVPTPAQSSLFAGSPVAPPTFTQATQAPEPPEQSGLVAEFAPEFDDNINQAIVSAERTLAGIPEVSAPPPSRLKRRIAPPAPPALKESGEEDWTDMSAFIRPTISGKAFVEARREEPTFASPVAPERTFTSQFPQLPETPEVEPQFETPARSVPAIMPSSSPPPSFLKTKQGRMAEINWYFDNMKAEGQSVLPQALRSKVIRQALKNVGSAKLEDKKVGVAKLNEQESNAVLSMLKRINAGETVVFDV